MWKLAASLSMCECNELMRYNEVIVKSVRNLCEKVLLFFKSMTLTLDLNLSNCATVNTRCLSLSNINYYWWKDSYLLS